MWNRPVYCFVLLILVAIAAGCRSASQKTVDEKNDPIHIGFNSGGWHFSWRVEPPGGGVPIEAFLVLHAEKNGQIVQVKKPDDIRKLNGIRITSSDQALSFVRLFTSKTTFYRFSNPRAFEFPEGNAIVTKAGNTFVIIRRLLYPEESDLKVAISPRAYLLVYEVKETVLPDGKYVSERLRVVDHVDENAVNLPLYK